MLSALQAESMRECCDCASVKIRHVSAKVQSCAGRAKGDPKDPNTPSSSRPSAFHMRHSVGEERVPCTNRALHV